MSLSDEDVQRIAKAVADEFDDRKEARRVAQARHEVACISCESPMTGSTCWRCGTVQK